MRKKKDKSLQKFDRHELLELMLAQAEELEHTQQALREAEARAAHQERIARMAEDAVARLAGILEAAQLHQEHYSMKLRELKAEMGLKVEAACSEAENSSATQATLPAAVDLSVVEVDEYEEGEFDFTLGGDNA